MKKWLWFLLKAGVSFSLLFFLFSRVEMGNFLQPLKEANLRYLLAALCLYLIYQILCAIRWRILAYPLGFQESIPMFIYYYYTGMFFNLFLPTSIGGDISRCYYLARGEAGWEKALFSVLADRGIGFLSLVLIVTVALFQPSGMLFSRTTRLGIIGLAIFLGLMLIIPFFLKDLFSPLKSPLNLPLVFWQRPSLLFKALFLSILFQLIAIGAHILIGISLSIKIPWDFYLIFPPLASAASMLPLTISGLGVREGAYVLLLSKAGISWEMGLAFALGWFLVLFSASLIGGLIWITYPVEGKRDIKEIWGHR